MAEPDPESTGLRGSLRRTVGRVTDSVEEAAFGLTGATTQQVITDLEPYLVAEAVPRILEGITPHLIETLVPQVIEGITPFLSETVVPEVMDGVTQHLVQTTVPDVMEGITPALVEQLLPRILDGLRPYLADDLIPPLLEDLRPYLEAELAPKLVDALLPKIRSEIVPVILADIVDDPSVRELIREQSAGLVQDALESLRENTADVDDLVEKAGRRLVGRKPRTGTDSGLALVLEATPGGAPARAGMATLARKRRDWQSMALPPAPPGREYAYAGIVTRLLAFMIDVTLIGWVVSQGLSAFIGLLESLFGDLPSWLVLTFGVAAASLVPLYLALCWYLTGRTLGSWLMGFRISTADGHRPGFFRALFRAVLELAGVTVFLITSSTSLFDKRRRTMMDMLAHTEVRYVVPKEQQARYIRLALAERAAAATE